MVVQIVPERVDQVDGVVLSNGIGMAREKHEGDVANVVTNGSVSFSSRGGFLWLKRTWGAGFFVLL